MKITINLPDSLIKELLYLSEAKTKTSAVNMALEEWI